MLVLASQLAAKQGRIDTAVTYADTAVTTARRSGRPVLLAAATPLRRTGRIEDALQAVAEELADRLARAATDTARALLDAGDLAGAFAQLRRLERAAPAEAHCPSVRALTARIAEHRPGLPGLAAYARRTTAEAELLGCLS